MGDAVSEDPWFVAFLFAVVLLAFAFWGVVIWAVIRVVSHVTGAS